MVITESTIYWVTRLDALRYTPLYLGLVVAIVGLIIWLHGKQPQTYLKHALCFWACSALLIPLVWFIPTTKQMCAIKVIPVITNNDEVQELPNKLVELANNWIEELSPKQDKGSVIESKDD